MTATIAPGIGIAESITRATLDLLSPFRPAELPVDPDFATRRGERIAMELRFQRFDVEGVGELRWTTLTSARADIVALMLFPNEPQALPIFASEFVVIAGRCKAAVVDFQSVATNAERRRLHSEPLRAIAPAYAAWRATELPAWCADHFTPHAIAALAVDMDDIGALFQGYHRYLATYTRLAHATGPHPARDTAELRHYKHHHITHTPGRPMMSAALGAQWTERFLVEGMYA